MLRNLGKWSTMRCPVCSTPLNDGAVKCDECGCGILPPPPAGAEPTPFVHPATTPKWPLVLSIVGVIAALAVVAVALLPLFDGDDDEVRTANTGDVATSMPAAGVESSAATTAAPTTAEPAATSVATSVGAAGVTTTDAQVSTSSSPSSSTAPSSTTAGASTSTSTTSTAGATTTSVATTTTAASAFPSPVIIALVEASCTAPDSTDSRGNRVTFNPLLTVDGVPDTAWRCPGASLRQFLLYSLAQPTDVTVVAAIPGYAGSDPFNDADRFDQNRRVTSARWVCLAVDGSDVASANQTFTSERRMQGLPVTGFTKCSKILFEIVDSSAPGNRDYTAVSEIGIYGPA